MGAVKQKLKSKRGASIILALVFFLICAVVGSIVLASASSNAGRLSHMRDEQQAYLTVSSAAKLVREELEGQRYTVVATSVDEVAPIYEYPQVATGSLAAMMNEWAGYIYTGDYSGYAPQGGFSITSDLEGVTAEFYMNGNYNVTVVFKLGDTGQYTTTLTIDAVFSSTSETIVNDIRDEETDELLGTTTTTITTTTIAWGEGTITKGGAA